MPSFDNLKRYETKDTVEFVLDVINPPNCPVLVVAPFGESNRPLMREILRQGRTRPRTTSEAAYNENTRLDKELMATHVVRGWRNVVDSEGHEVPFSKENALEFLQALPAWIFTRLRAFVTDPSNFVEQDGDLLGN